MTSLAWMATNALLRAHSSYLALSAVCTLHGPPSKHYSSLPCSHSTRNGLGLTPRPSIGAPCT
ncbi:uncharacterized protein BJ212DRAFT_1322104 [Suillus subaureus]|uniref:Secreted protein n=1 Tax=Suillus subaureus TaxID=48587 RepID=A0A9P7JIY9_9AGAM|nr:uncharacterized protein BJ212DRAFT_1322104 [Suillus subaureus]KAG1824729.1 hypothetical protein BJ212DRAFT_1322104 [Suillus subaureus]